MQHLSLIAHGMADTLITPINDSFLDLDVLVAIERSDLEPQPSVYAKTVWRALEARRKVSGRATDWIVVRNRLESVEIKQSASDQSGPGRDSKRLWVFALHAVCWSSPYIASFSPRG